MKHANPDVNFLNDMVSIYSPTGEEGKLVDHLVVRTRKLGFRSRKDDAGNLVCEIGSGEKTIMLVGHLDTVPGEIKVELKDNHLHGRGSVDAKGALASFIMAAGRLKKAGKRIVVVGCVDEEGDNKGARNLVGKYSPSFIIMGEPSGWQNLNIGYKGTFAVECVFEKPMEHTSTYNPNSKELAFDLFSKVKKFCDEFNEGKGIFERLDPSIRSVNSVNRNFSEETRIKISFRVPVGFDISKLKNFLANAAGSAKIFYSDFDEPVKAGKNNDLVKSFISAIRRNGGTPRFKLKAGSSDMNILQRFGEPIITYGPGDSTLDHTPHEHLDLEEYEKSISVLVEVLERL
jgi:LysW-gamma-L-lysine carboxypeptidase